MQIEFGGVVPIERVGGNRCKAAVDIETCLVKDVQLQLGGSLGDLIGDRPELKTFLQGYAQGKLTEVCGR